MYCLLENTTENELPKYPETKEKYVLYEGIELYYMKMKMNEYTVYSNFPDKRDLRKILYEGIKLFIMKIN